MAQTRFKPSRAEPAGLRGSAAPEPPACRGERSRGGTAPAAAPPRAPRRPRRAPNPRAAPAGPGAHSPGRGAHCGSAPAAGSGRGRLPLRSRAAAGVTPSLRQRLPPVAAAPPRPRRGQRLPRRGARAALRPRAVSAAGPRPPPLRQPPPPHLPRDRARPWVGAAGAGAEAAAPRAWAAPGAGRR